MANLMEGMLEELNRNRDLLRQYETVGPAGAFGAAVIREKIATGEKTIAENDVVQMLKAYNALTESK